MIKHAFKDIKTVRNVVKAANERQKDEVYH